MTLNSQAEQPETDASREVLLKSFRALQVRHRKMGEMMRTMQILTDPEAPANIVFLIGPTGIGKTNLCLRVLHALVVKNSADNECSNDQIPYIFVPAPANGDRSLSWKSLYTHALQSAGDIFTDKKLAREISGGNVLKQSGSFSTLAALRTSLDNVLRHRKVRVLVIDEAYHLLRFGNYSAVMDTLKSIADMTETKILLVGTYDLAGLAEAYAQVARRAEVVHFERYKVDSADDVAEFRRVLAKLQQHYPCKETPNFVAVTKELMEYSLGCLGLLKDILRGALLLQLRNSGVWNTAFLIRSIKSAGLREQIRREIELGEAKVADLAYGGNWMDKAAQNQLDKAIRRGGAQQ